jgi:tripartite-type tricarboxylate transporter receptor subunit TctC
MNRLLSVLLLLALPTFATAQAWPSKPVRLIVPFGPAGPIDIMSRTVAPYLSKNLGQPVIVDNRPGAGGALGIDLLSKAAADGYTIATTAPGVLTIAPHTSKLPFSPETDLAYVSMVGQVLNLLIVNGKLPIRSVEELLKAARDKPGSINFASSGVGTNGHLAGELLKQVANIDIVHIPYKSGGAALADVVAGNAQISFVAASGSILPLVKNGQIRALALTSARRSDLVPEVPSAPEAGVPTLITADVYGLVAPAKTPAEIVRRLNAEMGSVLRNREVVDRFREQLTVATPSTPQEYREWMQAESARWGAVIKRGKITAE